MNGAESPTGTAKQKGGKTTYVPFLLLLVLLLFLAALFPWTPLGQRFLPKREVVKTVVEKVPVEKIVEVEKLVEVEVEVEGKKRIVYADLANRDVRRTAKGFDLLSKVDVEESGELASKVRKEGANYYAQYDLKVKLPKAAQTLEELEAVNGELGRVLPDLAEMVKSAKVSKFYGELYENKLSRLKRDVLRLDALITTHNFFDTQTVLNLTHPESNQKLLLVQSDMDVVTDGSDGDRLPVMPLENVQSPSYQFSTSWWWKKVTDRPNPMIEGFKHRMGNADKEIAGGEATADRVRWLKKRKGDIKGYVKEAQSHSFLLAEYDPFIVMPTPMIIDRSDSHSPRAGDYAVVIFQDKVYPCIVGDAGPTYKMGEASLRLAKELNAKANKGYRPISDLTVTYVVFPQSRGDRKQPNYEEWREKCAALLEKVGGLGEGVELFEWEVTIPPIEIEEEEPVETEDVSAEG